MSRRCRTTDKFGLVGFAGTRGNVGDATPEVVNIAKVDDLSPG